jgi:hypothetical protein
LRSYLFLKNENKKNKKQVNMLEVMWIYSNEERELCRWQRTEPVAATATSRGKRKNL